MYRARPSADPTRAAREREWEAIRNNLGCTRAYLPAKLGRRFLRKLPSDCFAESVEVDLSRAAGDLKFEWFEPDTETTVVSGTIVGGGKHAFAAPVRGDGLVLYIHTS